MVSKKTILNNELLKEVISIRVNTLWKMLALEEQGKLPGVEEEGATGKYDNKGAIFVPGGLIHQDVDEEYIDYTPSVVDEPEEFRKQIRDAMRYDNATLLFPDGIVPGVNLDSGFFSKAARRINTYKKSAFKRKKKIGRLKTFEIDSGDIIRSHCPAYFSPPYGSRTRASSYVAMGLVEPAIFFFYCIAELNFCEDQKEIFARKFDSVRDPVLTRNGVVLYSPQIVVCHDSRYSKASYTGLTRILGIGKFGEFCTFTLEKAETRLHRELKRKKQEYSQTDIFAEYRGRRVLGILRIYDPTNPGKRSQKYKLHVVSPVKDLGLNVEQLEKEAREQYGIEENLNAKGNEGIS